MPNTQKRNIKPKNNRERLARDRAISALAIMRRDKLSLTAAAKQAQTDPETVRRYVGSALVRSGTRGQYKARTFDRIPRRLKFLASGGAIPITVHSSRTASLIAEHMNAVRKYLRTGDESVLKSFRGKQFRAGKQTYEFVTDTEVLHTYGNAGFRGEGLYRAVQGGQA